MTSRAKAPAPLAEPPASFVAPTPDVVTENIVESVAHSFGEPTPELVTPSGVPVKSAFADAGKTVSEDVKKQAAASVENFVAETQKAMTERLEKLSKRFEGVTAFNQENIDALVKSSEIAAKAAEGIGSEVSAYSRKAFEESVTAAQNLASAKTFTELVGKQTAFAQTAFNGFLEQSTKMNEILVAATKEITAPLGQRVTAATERMKSFAL